MKLTDRKKSPLGAEPTDLVHIVKTGDTSQNSAGSSYKAEMIDYDEIFLGTFVTGGTHNKVSGVSTFTNNKGVDFTVSDYFRSVDDKFISGMTFNPSNYDLTINRNDGVNFTESLAILATDMTITGGTFNSSTGIATFNNNMGGSFNVTGFLIQDNYQKIIIGNYTLTNADNNYTILINNGTNAITITLPSGLTSKFQVGFIQQGTGNVTFVGSGATILTPIVGAFKIKGQNYNSYLEQVGSTNVYHLLGNLKV
jgi:hypothetical protein